MLCVYSFVEYIHLCLVAVICRVHILIKALKITSIRGLPSLSTNDEVEGVTYVKCFDLAFDSYGITCLCVNFPKIW
jgi:hypothetical protein